MVRICIVTPGQVGSNPRVVKEADALVQAGYKVQVVATKILEFVEPRDQEIISAANWSIERIQFDANSWRVERLRQEIARRLFLLTRSSWAAAIAG